MRLNFEAGTEKYIQYAKNRLAVLSEMRKALGLPSMVKQIVPESGVMIQLRSTETEEYIRITGGIGAFLVIPRILAPTNVTYTGTTRCFIPKKLNSVSDFPVAVSFVSDIPFFPAGGKKSITAARTPLAVNGYLTGPKFTSGGYPAQNHIFKYSGAVYSISGSGQVYTFGTGDEVSGSFPQSSWSAQHAIDGKVLTYRDIGSGFRLDALTMSTSDEGLVSVTYEPQVAVSPFGTEHTVLASDIVVTGVNTSPTPGASATESSSQTIEHDVTYPVCMAFNADGTTRQISARSEYSYSLVRDHAETNSITSDTFTAETTTTFEESEELTITVPTGETFPLTLRDSFIDSSGTAAGHASGTTTSGSGTYDSETRTVSFTSLHASASWNEFTYWTIDTDVVVTSDGGVALQFPGAKSTGTSVQTTRTRVVSIIDGVEQVLFSDEVVEAPVAVSNFVSAAVGYSVSSSTGSDTTADLSSNPYYKGERLNDGDGQFGRLATGEYLGSALFFDSANATQAVMFSSKSDLTALKLALINRVLTENSQPVIEDITGYKVWFAELRIV